MPSPAMSSRIEALARQNGAGNNEMQAQQYAQQAT